MRVILRMFSAFFCILTASSLAIAADEEVETMGEELDERTEVEAEGEVSSRGTTSIRLSQPTPQSAAPPPAKIVSGGDDKIAAKKEQKEATAEKHMKEREKAWADVATSVGAATSSVGAAGTSAGTASTTMVVGTFVKDGKTYVVLRNPWGQAVVVESDNSTQPARTKTTQLVGAKTTQPDSVDTTQPAKAKTPFVRRGDDPTEAGADQKTIERALAYCKAKEATGNTCGFTLVQSCPEEWTIGNTFQVGDKSYTACFGAGSKASQ